MFLVSYVRKEALYSSKIEGTQATLEDILDSGNESGANVDVEDVMNCVRATNYSIELTKELPICNRYFKKIHEVLLQGDLKRNQLEYYDRISNVRLRDDYIGWIDFFLQGIIEISQESIQCIHEMVILRNDNLRRLNEKDSWLLTYLERNPIIDAKKTSEKTGVDYYKVNRTINKYVELGILIVSNDSKRRRTYVYEKYVNLLKK